MHYIESGRDMLFISKNESEGGSKPSREENVFRVRECEDPAKKSKKSHITKQLCNHQ